MFFFGEGEGTGKSFFFVTQKNLDLGPDPRIWIQ